MKFLGAPILFPVLLTLSLALPMGAVASFNAPKSLNSRQLMGSQETLKELENVGIDEKVGENIDPTIPVINGKGEVVPLGDYFKLGKPLLLSPIYYSCPGLCNFHLNGVVEGLAEMEWTAGDQYEVLVFSFDHTETPELGEAKKEFYMDQLYKRPEGNKGFHFLTGSEDTVQRLTSAVGFKFAWNEQGQEWAHASAAIVLTPDGKISRYLHGIMFEPQTLRLALNEAGDGRVGGIVDRIMLYCFQYDSSQSKYTLAAFRVVQLGGALTILVLAAWLVPFWIRARREDA